MPSISAAARSTLLRQFVFSRARPTSSKTAEVGRPARATLIGNGPDVLTRVSMVGSDLKLDEGVGTCGKDGQSVPVGVGQPTLKVDSLTVVGRGNGDIPDFAS